jgi:hypothetical protein
VRRFLCAALALTGFTRVASAQVQAELEPVIGVYAGFSDWIRPATGLPFGFPDTLSQRTAVAFGGQATVWLGHRVGLRASVLSSASKVGPATHELLLSKPVPAHVTTAGLEALVPIATPPNGGRVFLAGGAAVVLRSGEANQGFEGTNDVAGTLGVGSQFRLTDRLMLQADLRALLYSLHLTDPEGLEYQSAFQTDLQGHVGVSLRLSSSSSDE